MNFLNNDAGIYTSARDRGDGKPITDVSILDKDGNEHVGGVPTKINESSIIQPVDIQTRYSQTIQTQNAVSVGATTTSHSAWIDCEGFNEIAVTYLNDASTSFKLYVFWSNDGVTNHGGYSSVLSNSIPYESVVISTRARYFKIGLNNLDTVAHTMSAWAYLKA